MLKDLLKKPNELKTWSETDKNILTSIAYEEQNIFSIFVKQISKVCILIGCPLPTSESLVIIYEYFISELSWMKISEINICFNLYLKNELNGINGDQMQHFQSFDGKFFSGVVMNYKKRRDSVYLRAVNEIPKLTEKTDSEKELEYKEATKKILFRILEDFNMEKPLIFAVKYLLLAELGIISLTVDRKLEYVKKAELRIKNKALAEKNMKMIREINSGVKIDSKATAMNIAYEDFLKDKENIKLIENELAK